MDNKKQSADQLKEVVISRFVAGDEDGARHDLEESSKIIA